MKTKSQLSVMHLQRAKRARFNPIGTIEPATLTRYLDAFEAGYLREAANIWDLLEQRDDLLRGVISKRKKSVARHGWTILTVPDLEPREQSEAQAHAQALEFFYRNLRCEHAVDVSEQGGFKLLVRQMMDAVGKKFAVHEIVWRVEPNPPGGTNRRWVTAKFRFVPLGFFENTTGELRFLESESTLEGRKLEPGAWMVTVGDGLMAASSVAWMFKHITLNDWLNCSKSKGTPGLRGITTAARDSADWKALETALDDLLDGQPIVHGANEDLRVVDLIGGGDLPFPKLVERIDRMLAALWRGADLSTLSRDRGYGASLQEKETCALEEDDSEMLTETLNRHVDEWVIRYVFGPEVKPLARVKVLVSPRECTTADLQVDEFLLRHGAPLSLTGTLSRYGRSMPGPAERLLARAGSSGARSFQASLPESSHEKKLDNAENQDLQTVSFRGCSTRLDRRSPNAIGSMSSIPAGTSSAAHQTPTEALANQFILLQEDWLQLSPYGDFPHARGVQRVDREAAEALAAQFHSFRGRLGRLFGGVPLYVGHPDLPNASELADRKAYGWIMELQAREDGLHGRVKWSEAGLELLRNGHFKFLSPYWEAREIATENGRKVYRPVALLSVGLTNQPNLPVKPLANEAREDQGSNRPETEKDRTEALAVENGGNPAVNVSLPPVDAPGDEGGAERLPSRHGPCLAAAIENALARGAIIPADVSNWVERLKNNFEETRCMLEKLPPAMHTVSSTGSLGGRRLDMIRFQNRRDRIQECVLSKMRLGLTYDQAWESVKREHRRWFEE